MKVTENSAQDRVNASAFDSEQETEGKSLTPPPFQLKAGDDAPSLPQDNGSGKSSNGLPQTVQAKMEQTLGADFSGVNIHAESSKASEAGALAYTQGKDVHFAPGQFQPDTQKGQELIGHELTHVVQQQKGQVRPTGEVNGMALNDDPGLEQQADIMGAKAAQAKVDPSADSKKPLAGGGGGAVQAKMEDAPVGQEEMAGPEGGAPQADGKMDPAVVMAQEIAAEAGLTQLAALPNQEVAAPGGQDQTNSGPQQQKAEAGPVQRKAGGQPIQRWGWLKKLWNGVKSVGKSIWGGIKTLAGWAWTGIKAVTGYVWNVIKSVAALGHALIIKVWPRIWKLIVHLGTGAVDLVKWVWNGIKTTFTQPGQLGKWFVDGLLGGLAWTGRLFTKLLDIVGLAEILDLLGQVIKFNTRSLTGTEIAEAQKVFGGAVPYWKVRVDEYSLIAKIGKWVNGYNGLGVTIGYTINFSQKVSPAPGNNDMHWLIHELTHVAQCEAVGLQYIPEALIAQAGTGYNYGGPAGLAGKRLKDFNREQQGDICADYYRDVLYGNPADTSYNVVIADARNGDF